MPLKRVNQAYVIATSTKVALPAKLPVDCDDAYFAKEAAPAKEGEDKFFAAKKTETTVSEQRKSDQVKMDKVIVAAVEKADPMLKAYLQAIFTLSKGDKPHEMKF